MKLEFFDSESCNFLCDRYKVHDCKSFTELLDEVKNLESKSPEFKFLITLDDLSQACYTSMHSIGFFDLNNIDDILVEELPSNLPPECFDTDGSYLGDFEYKEEFSIRKNNIDKRLDEFSFKDICDKDLGLYYEKDFDEANKNPFSILDSEIYILKVPVKYSYETICAFPNGYFDSDLNPFETIILSKTLYEKFAYELIGIGASYIAFRKTKEIDESKAKELIALLKEIYSDEFDENLCKSYIQNNDYLILSYVE